MGIDVSDQVSQAAEWHKVAFRDGYWYISDGRCFQYKHDAEVNQFIHDLDNWCEVRYAPGIANWILLNRNELVDIIGEFKRLIGR